ncbi:MAG: NADH-quinone oxidoreductase subunit NuoH [Actinomycetota bacterium]
MDWLDWILLVGKVVVVFAAMLITVMLVIWMERKVLADMQNRIGPNRAGPFGLLITLADGIKLFFKEGVRPKNIDRPVYVLAPILSLIPAFLAFAVVPFGTVAHPFGRVFRFQVADLDIGILWVLAMTSMAVYGIVLAGWSSGSKYPLLGAIRSSAQIISYEVGMGLALVAVIMYSGALSMSGIVASQNHLWNAIPQLPAFVVYLIAALAETNRPPFDLPEAETELVAGYQTEYSGIKFALFYLAEYLNMVTVSAIAVTLFLGGPRGPHIAFLPWLWPIVWFLLKVLAIGYVYIWIRATLPRFRYDRLMNFGWKFLIPFGLLWVLFTGALVVLPAKYGKGTFLKWAAIVIAVLLLLSAFWPASGSSRKQERVEEAS